MMAAQHIVKFQPTLKSNATENRHTPNFTNYLESDKSIFPNAFEEN